MYINIYIYISHQHFSMSGNFLCWLGVEGGVHLAERSDANKDWIMVKESMVLQGLSSLLDSVFLPPGPLDGFEKSELNSATRSQLVWGDGRRSQVQHLNDSMWHRQRVRQCVETDNHSSLSSLSPDTFPRHILACERQTGETLWYLGIPGESQRRKDASGLHYHRMHNQQRVRGFAAMFHCQWSGQIHTHTITNGELKGPKGWTGMAWVHSWVFCIQ